MVAPVVRNILLQKPPFSLTATASAVDTNALITYTFSSQNFGPAKSSRVIAILILSRHSTGTQIVSSATIGGIAATLGVAALGGGNLDSAEIWYAAVPNGTSGTVSITFAGAGNQRCGLQVYSIISPRSAAPAATGTSVANAGTATITIPAGGAAIGGSFTLTGGPGTPTATPSSPANGFNNLDLNNNIAGTQQVFAFHSNAGAIVGSQTLTMTLTSGSTTVSAFAVWGT
jgi:hypothetical protein